MTEAARRAWRVLVNYRQAERRIAERRERLAQLTASATRATSSMEAGRTSGTGARSRVEQAMITKIDLEAQLAGGLREQAERLYKIQAAIDALEDAREARLLELRYIDGRSWAGVMARMGISETWSRAIHESALLHFSEKFFG